MDATVLIAEDDGDIVELLTLYLSGSGYEVLSASDGAEALEIVRSRPVDVALVDIMMPRVNGYDFIKAVRQESDIPIIIVSARNLAADKIVGLDAGADGYITKPFDPLEVTAYIRAVLRRHAQAAPVGRAASTGAPVARDAEATAHVMVPQVEDALARAAMPVAPEAIVVGPLVFDPERLVLTKDGELIPLTAAELKIMVAFMSAPGRVFSKDQLYACVSGEPVSGGAASVMVHISNIRSKLEDDPLRPQFIKTVRGLGYRLDG